MTIFRGICHTLAASGAGLLILSSCTTERDDGANACAPPCAMNPSPIGGGGMGGATSTAGASGAAGIAGSTAGTAGVQAAAGASGGAGAAGIGTSGGAGAAGSAGENASAGGEGGTGGMDDAGTAGSSGTGQTLPPITDYSEEGPFATTSTPNAGPGGDYTIFRPEPLGEDGFLHSPLIWGPGILTQVSSYTALLTNIASHGFVVVAVNSLSAGPGAEANRTPMLDGLEWIIAQNDEPGVFQGKLDVNRAVSMGYSIGGTAAVQVGAHPSVITTVSIHGHSATSELHGPMLQTTGTQDSVGLPLQQDTYDASEVQTFLATLDGASHTYILGSGGGEQRPAIVAWLRLWVYGDEGARGFFHGDDCTLCVDPWTNPQRKNWP